MIKRRDFLKATGSLALLPLSIIPLAVDSNAQKATPTPTPKPTPSPTPEDGNDYPNTYIIMEPCVGVKDTACVDVCPVDAIYGKNEDWEILYINPKECIDCGKCLDACPVEAIAPRAEVPDKWHSWIAKNYEHFGLTPPK